MGEHTLCAAADCDRPARSRGLCSGHYKRQQRGHDLNAPLRGYSQPFDDYVDDTGSCWTWLGAMNSNGYGRYRPRGHRDAPLLAHRVAYERANGPIPQGLHLDRVRLIRLNYVYSLDCESRAAAVV